MYPEDISPPDSPDTNNEQRIRSRRHTPEISPIAESPNHLVDGPQSLDNHNSHIPILKKTQRFGGAGALFSGWRSRGAGIESPERDSSGTTLTRWDDFSGEPTDSETGKPAQATPGHVRFGSESSPAQGNGSHGRSPSIGSGMMLAGRKASNRIAAQKQVVREEWKGASGRSKIMNPLMDKPLPPGKSITFPAGYKRHPKESGEQESPSANSSCSTQHAMDQPSALSETNRSFDPVDMARKPVPADILTPPATQESAQSVCPSPTDDDRRSPLARNPSNEEMRERPSPTLPDLSPCNSDGEQTSGPIEDKFRAAMHDMQLEGQPASRFSATTYATTAYDSPPATPKISSETVLPVTSPLSILNRKRPIPVAGTPNTKVAARKPTPLETMTSTATDNRNSKALPKRPAEIDAIDRVAMLQAKLDTLRRRRGNLQTVIHELTHVVQPSSIAYDLASRQEIKKTVNSLNTELAEVMKEEHETGLKLHRAWKRRDSKASYEPTSLWVRRVTS